MNRDKNPSRTQDTAEEPPQAAEILFRLAVTARRIKLSPMPPYYETLDIGTLKSWLWEAACKIRGEVDATNYKDYILPLIFLKRISDVFEDELTKLEEDYGNQGVVEELQTTSRTIY